MSSFNRDNIIDTLTDWMADVGALHATLKIDKERSYVDTEKGRVYLPAELLELAKTL